MAITVKKIVAAQQVPNANTTIYTAVNCKAVIDKFTLTNTTGASVTATVFLVASGGGATAANTIISAKSIAAGETYTCPELIGQVLESGGFIVAIAGAAASLTVSAAGREIT